MNLKRIVITGGPGTGKTAIINKLKSKGYTCFDEYSRILIRWGYENGIKKFFLEKPNLFTSKIIDGRKKQYNDSRKIEKSKGNLLGVIAQFGGQTPIKLAKFLHKNSLPILGTQYTSIDLAEDRDRFKALLNH